MQVHETQKCILTIVSSGRCSFKFLRKPEEEVEAIRLVIYSSRYSCQCTYV
jgi:hypothetical protein